MYDFTYVAILKKPGVSPTHISKSGPEIVNPVGFHFGDEWKFPSGNEVCVQNAVNRHMRINAKVRTSEFQTYLETHLSMTELVLWSVRICDENLQEGDP